VPRFSNVGGMLGFGSIDTRDEYQPFEWVWEARVWALSMLMSAKGHHTVDEKRDMTERLPATDYLEMTYYERWLSSLESLLAEHGVIDRKVLDDLVAQAEHDEGKEHFHWPSQAPDGSRWEQRYE
jgi:hypothetical protein